MSRASLAKALQHAGWAGPAPQTRKPSAVSNVRVEYGAFRDASQKLRAAVASNVTKPEATEIEVRNKLRIAHGLLRLQAAGVLRVWIDEDLLRVARMGTHVFADGERRPITWKRAQEIVDRGGLK